MIQPNRDRYVRGQTGVKADLPSMAPVVMGLATCQHDRNAELLVHSQEIRGGITHDGAAEIGDCAFGVIDDFRVKLAQELVDLQKLVVTVRREANGFVGPDQASEAVDVCRG